MLLGKCQRNPPFRKAAVPPGEGTSALCHSAREVLGDRMWLLKKTDLDSQLDCHQRAEPARRSNGRKHLSHSLRESPAASLLTCAGPTGFLPNSDASRFRSQTHLLFQRTPLGFHSEAQRLV